MQADISLAAKVRALLVNYSSVQRYLCRDNLPHLSFTFEE